MRSDSLARLLGEEMPIQVRAPQFSRWRGRPVMTLPVSGGGTMTFGVRKAEAILNFIADISMFVGTVRDIDQGKPMPVVEISDIDAMEEEIADPPGSPATDPEEDWEARLEREVVGAGY
jgi:hypothetical protein